MQRLMRSIRNSISRSKTARGSVGPSSVDTTECKNENGRQWSYGFVTGRAIRRRRNVRAGDMSKTSSERSHSPCEVEAPIGVLSCFLRRTGRVSPDKQQSRDKRPFFALFQARSGAETPEAPVSIFGARSSVGRRLALCHNLGPLDSWQE